MRNFAHTGKETPWGIVTKICVWVDIHDLITCATFGDDRLRDLGVAMGRISRFPVDLRRRPYNTLALPCECVIHNYFLGFAFESISIELLWEPYLSRESKIPYYLPLSSNLPDISRSTGIFEIFHTGCQWSSNSKTTMRLNPHNERWNVTFWHFFRHKFSRSRFVHELWRHSNTIRILNIKEQQSLLDCLLTISADLRCTDKASPLQQGGGAQQGLIHSRHLTFGGFHGSTAPTFSTSTDSRDSRCWDDVQPSSELRRALMSNFLVSFCRQLQRHWTTLKRSWSISCLLVLITTGELDHNWAPSTCRSSAWSRPSWNW